MKYKIFAVVAVGVASLIAAMNPRDVRSAETPADRVVVMYFHRTQRCPTCLKMGGYTEEAIKTGFAGELKTGRVEFHFIDFQDPTNKALTDGYHVSGPTLLVAKVVDNKVKEHQSLKDIWTKVRDKPAFISYVQDQVKAYLK
jgi:hypothetical protein